MTEDLQTTATATAMAAPGETAPGETAPGETVPGVEPSSVRVGDRFVTKSTRSGPRRVVEVVELLGLSKGAAQWIRKVIADGQRYVRGVEREKRIEWIRQRGTRFIVRTVEHENPSAVGRRYELQENSLRDSFVLQSPKGHECR